jgi:phosphoglycerate dehydrogenase-like enzyme
MPNDNFSRRRFLKSVAAGSTGAAVASLAPLSRAQNSPALAGAPVTADSFPLAAPGPATGVTKIVTQVKLAEDHQQQILAAGPNIGLHLCGSPEDFRSQIADAHVVYGHFSREDFAAAKQLRWIQYTAAGVEGILSPELIESPVVLTNMARVYAPAISESVIGLILALARGLNRYAISTRERRWDRADGLFDISGMTMGLVGLGGIGTETAYRAHYGFGMRILAVDPKPIPKPQFVAELHSPDWLMKMLPQVDFLVSAAPHTRQTEKMFNDAVFRALKPSALFINVSRGKLVDPPALVRALKEGWIAGAGLDVTHLEPLPSDDPVWTAGNVLITGHTSGWTPRTPARQMALFSENVRRYVAGLPLLNVVDKQRGY